MFKTILLVILLSCSAFADSKSAAYEMNGATTYLWDQDVDYFSFPIQLIRNSTTYPLHRLEFSINSYQSYCAYFETRCVATDSQGRCTQWERYCARWESQVYQVEKRLEINFVKATPLAKGQEELYEITIDRTRPVGNGEDFVRTYLRADTVMKPVIVRKHGDYDYVVEVKP